jgi:hypothetical protein
MSWLRALIELVSRALDWLAAGQAAAAREADRKAGRDAALLDAIQKQTEVQDAWIKTQVERRARDRAAVADRVRRGL